MPKATGASAFFGVQLDSVSDLYSVGHPVMGSPPHLKQLIQDVPPPVVTVGGAGLLKGSFIWRVGYGIADGTTTSYGPLTDSNTTTPIGTPVLDDATFSGTYNGTGVGIFYVQIDSVGPADTFKWRKGEGPWTALVPIVAGPIVLGDNVAVEFTATTGHAMGDSWKRTMGMELNDEKATLDILAHAFSDVDRIIVERSSDEGFSWGLVGTIWSNTATPAWEDNIPDAELDFTHPLPAVGSIASNYGFNFLSPDSFDLEPDFTNLPVVALMGTAGPPRSIPGPIKIAGTQKSNVRPVDLFPFLMSGAGTPDSVTRVTDEPTVISVFNATTGKRKPRTMSAYSYVGSEGVLPQVLVQMACEELDFEFAGGKIDDVVPKLTGANYGVSAPAIHTAGAGNWDGTFNALGQRYDPKVATDDVFIKITQALDSLNTIKFVTKVGAAAAYGVTEYTIYAHPTSHLQTKGGAQYNDEVELYDENGLRLGADYGSNRQPYTLLATAPLTVALSVGDEFQIPRSLAIPGAGTAPYSGVQPYFRPGPRFTDAHVTFYKNGAVIEAQSGSVKLMFPKRPVTSLCAGARTLQDLPNEGFFAVQVQAKRFIDSSEYRQIIRKDDRIQCLIRLEGERIPVNPGVLSPYREGLDIMIPQLRLTGVKSPVTGQVLVEETIDGDAEQPDNPSYDLFTLTLTTRGGWIVP
jgi:hypothetical protein